MKKIDAHAHVFDHIGSMGKAGELRPLGNGNCRWATGEEFRIIPEGKGDKEYLVETFMDVMDENDVEKAILLQGVLYGLQNEYAMECAEKYPDRFKAAVMLDPFCRCAQQILEHFINDLHAHVFKFEVSVGGGLSGYHRDFAVDGPGLHIVVCHLLAPSLEDGDVLKCALPYLAHDNVWVDLSALPWNVAPEAYPYPTALEYIAMAKDVLGADKIIWGTDSPCVLTKFDYKDLYSFIEDSDVFTDAEKQGVFYDNAVKAYYL